MGWQREGGPNREGQELGHKHANESDGCSRFGDSSASVGPVFSQEENKHDK